MSDRTGLFVLLCIWTACVLYASHQGRSEGRCQAACWLNGYAYTTTDATACLCDAGGGAVAVAVPEPATLR